MEKKAHKGKVSRPPVIVITGHIDHGKSTLLDYIRKTNVVASEAGGITQHLSAYEVTHKKSDGSSQKITFIDTPGHAAFSGMRERGVGVADIAILIVSAEDGVKAQTIEAIKAIKESVTPFIVAINKIDKPNANVEKTKNELGEKEVFLEGYGGNVPFVEISAKIGTGVPELLDMILLVAELEELSFNPEKQGEGIIIESHLDQKRGISGALIVKDGTLKKGDFMAIEGAVSPIRIIEDFKGAPISESVAGSSVSMAGFSKNPKVGALFRTFPTKKEAEALAQEFVKAPHKESGSSIPVLSEEEEKLTRIIPITLKADAQGTLEALEKEIAKINTENVILKVTNRGIGTVSESDVKLALSGNNPIVIGFNVKAEAKGKDLAERGGVTIVLFDIIYKLTEWLEEEAKKRKPKVPVEETLGKAKIIRCFSKEKERQVIGGRVTEGVFSLGAIVKILRKDFEIGRGKVLELQQQKIKSKEVTEGNEFGLMIDSNMDVAEGDILESFRIVEK